MFGKVTRSMTTSRGKEVGLNIPFITVWQPACMRVVLAA